VAMYLVKRYCDRTLPEIAAYFGTGSYSAVSWSCRAIEAKMTKEKKLRERIERMTACVCQLSTFWPYVIRSGCLFYTVI